MDGQHRTRASSAGQVSNHLNPTPATHSFLGPPELDPINFASGSFHAGIVSSNPSTDLQYGFMEASARFDHVVAKGFNERNLDQPFQPNGIAADLQHRPATSTIQQSPQQFHTDLLGSYTANGFEEFSHQHPTAKPAQQFDSGFLMDSEFQAGIQPQHTSINPADIMNTMSSPQSMIPSPPTLMPPEAHSPRQGSPAPPQSQQLYTPGHSRHTSLDPSSAIFLHSHQQPDWSGMLQHAQFQSHRTAPSEHSDVSSVAPSPYLPQSDNFELDYNPSPLMNPLQDHQLYPGLGMEQFSLSDPQQNQQQAHGISPGHTPYDSPRMSPRMGLGVPPEVFMLPQDTRGNFPGGPGPEIYPNQSDAFPQFNVRHDSSDMGQAAQMTPPEINVEFAPTTKQAGIEPARTDNDLDTLSPPARGKAREGPGFGGC